MYLNTAIGIGWAMVIIFIYSFIREEDKEELQEFGMILLSAILIIMVPYMFLENQRILQGVGLFFGSIFSLYISWGLFNDRFKITYTSRLITVTMAIFMIVYTIEAIQQHIVYMTAKDTVFLLTAFGFEAEVVDVVDGTFVTFPKAEMPLRTRIVTACTGIGTIAVFTGLISSFEGMSLKQKIGLSFFIASLIYGLNAIRNFFIAFAYGYQSLHFVPNVIEAIFGRGDEWVSYYIADRIIAQIGSLLFISYLGYRLMNRYDSGLIEEWSEIVKDIKGHYDKIR